MLKRAAENFKWPKNREDSFDLDDLLTESIAATRPIFFENFVRRCHQKVRKTLEKLGEKSETLSVGGAKCSNMALDSIDTVCERGGGPPW